MQGLRRLLYFLFLQGVPGPIRDDHLRSIPQARSGKVEQRLAGLDREVAKGGFFTESFENLALFIIQDIENLLIGPGSGFSHGLRFHYA